MDRNESVKDVNDKIGRTSKTEEQTATVTPVTTPRKEEYTPPEIPITESVIPVDKSAEGAAAVVPMLPPVVDLEAPKEPSSDNAKSDSEAAEKFDNEDLDKEAIEVVAMTKKKKRGMMKLFGK